MLVYFSLQGIIQINIIVNTFLNNTHYLLIILLSSSQIMICLITYNNNIDTQIASKLLSTESAVAVKTIRNIIKNFPEFGVIDIFSEYPTKDIVMSIIALSRLQRAVYSTESALLPTTTTSNYDWFTFDDDNGGDTGGRVGIHLLKRAFQRSKDTLMGKTNNSYTYRNDNDLEIEQNLLSDLAHYSIFANVAYGWKMGLLGGRLHIGDLKTLLSRTGVKEAHVIDTNWKSKTHLPVCEEIKKVVLSLMNEKYCGFFFLCINHHVSNTYLCILCSCQLFLQSIHVGLLSCSRC